MRISAIVDARFSVIVDGVARKVSFTNPSYQHLQIAPISHSCGESQEQKVAPRHEGVGQAVLLHFESGVARERGVADFAQHGQVQQMVLAEFLGSVRKSGADFLQYDKACIEFHPVALAVVKGDGLDPLVLGECQGEASGGVLATGKKNKGRGVHGQRMVNQPEM